MPLFILQLIINTEGDICNHEITVIITKEVIFVLITRNRQNTDICIVGDKRPNLPIAKGSPETSEIQSSGVFEGVRRHYRRLKLNAEQTRASTKAWISPPAMDS